MIKKKYPIKKKVQFMNDDLPDLSLIDSMKNLRLKKSIHDFPLHRKPKSKQMNHTDLLMDSMKTLSLKSKCYHKAYKNPYTKLQNLPRSANPYVDIGQTFHSPDHDVISNSQIKIHNPDIPKPLVSVGQLLFCPPPLPPSPPNNSSGSDYINTWIDYAERGISQH
ncbi:hypothetical protein BC833DRAFT_572151 [Globomyces pollinis-pini]|nr:hypothetical protein BC833DRAFT_572151 [Globomyces pollinis-pini]